MDRRLHPWDERIGADASVVNVNRGKRMFTDRDTYASSVNLPLGRPSLEPQKRSNSTLPRVSSEQHIWKTYHESIAEKTEGMTKATQHECRSKVRQRILAVRDQIAALQETHVSQRRELSERHEAHRSAETSVIRDRCAVRGIEGLVRPSLRSPVPESKIPSDLIESFVQKLTPKVASNVEIHRPFGPPIGSKCEPVARWEGKTFS